MSILLNPQSFYEFSVFKVKNTHVVWIFYETVWIIFNNLLYFQTNYKASTETLKKHLTTNGFPFYFYDTQSVGYVIKKTACKYLRGIFFLTDVRFVWKTCVHNVYVIFSLTNKKNRIVSEFAGWAIDVVFSVQNSHRRQIT